MTTVRNPAVAGTFLPCQSRRAKGDNRRVSRRRQDQRTSTKGADRAARRVRLFGSGGGKRLRPYRPGTRHDHARHLARTGTSGCRREPCITQC